MNFKVNPLIAAVILVFLSLNDSQGGVLESDQNTRIFDVYTHFTTSIVKSHTSKTDLIFRAKAYFKAHKQRQFTYHIGLYDLNFSLEGEVTKIKNLSKCESFNKVSDLLREPALAIYDKHGVFEYIEVRKTALEEVKDLLFLIANNVQLNRPALRQQFKPFYVVNATERTDNGIVNVTYNVEAKKLPGGTESYWINKDYLPSSKSTNFDNEEQALDQDEICNSGEAMKIKGFEAVGMDTTINDHNNLATQLKGIQIYDFKSFIPLKQSTQEMIIAVQRNLTLIKVVSNRNDHLREFNDDNPQIMTKTTHKRIPDEAIMSGESGGKAPDLAEVYKNLACDENKSNLMMLFYEQAVYCADKLKY